MMVLQLVGHRGDGWPPAAAAPLAASPDPTVLPGTDIRTGTAAGVVGDPLFAVLGVAALGILSVGATLAWVRLTGGRARR
jgi:hypothetical protein